VNNAVQTLVTLQAEIDRATGRNRPLQLADKPNTPFLSGVVTETLRMSQIVPMNLMRDTEEDTVVGGFSVPKGTAIAAEIAVIMSDPKVFEEPMVVRASPSPFDTLVSSSNRRDLWGPTWRTKSCHSVSGRDLVWESRWPGLSSIWLVQTLQTTTEYRLLETSWPATTSLLIRRTQLPQKLRSSVLP
jgi:hypothetical protein